LANGDAWGGGATRERSKLNSVSLQKASRWQTMPRHGRQDNIRDALRAITEAIA
jgi:hypothetical protein